MSREQLAADARRVGSNAVHNLKWMRKHPDRYDMRKREEMEAHLRMMARMARSEKKNARLAGRTSWRTRSKELLFFILSLQRKTSSRNEGR